MKLYLVRHGQTEWNVIDRVQGQSQNPLNETGLAQARALAPEIAKLNIEYFYCSPLLRARQTAAILNEKLQRKIIYNKLLKEKCQGKMQGHIRQTYPHRLALQENPHKYRAETWEDVFKRTQKFLSFLKRKNHDNALVVTHGGIISAIKHRAENKTAPQVDNCSLTIIEF
jgi:broad specificity phosphatase PhoE